MNEQMLVCKILLNELLSMKNEEAKKRQTIKIAFISRVDISYC